MKVGTDGILLGAWTQLAHPSRILDIGCGSGLIALMLAQRTQSKAVAIDALDIDVDAVRQTQQNIDHSPWPTRVTAHEADLAQFDGPLYSHIVSNPPYFPHGQRYSDPRRAIARQTYSLTHQALLEHAARLALPDGSLSLVLPFDEGCRLASQSEAMGWYLRRQCDVITNVKQIKPQRILLEFRRESGNLDQQQLMIYQQPDVYSEEFTRLCRDFYLYFT